ncbi:hypothetical protein [Thalassoglobus sp.]|uniref:hypothetical protein n=1 Tax=Thalassoglobus sp. TaxID=2795869 RepID=UPI003AA972E9
MSNNLQQQERIIADAMAKPFEIGQALRTIRDEKLYKESHDTYEGYVTERWKITKSGAYQKIKCADVQDVIDKSKLPALNNEAQATELGRLKIEKSSKLDENSIRAIWKEATSHKDRPATQPFIRELIAKHLGKETQVWYDKQLKEIHKAVLKFRKRLSEESASVEIAQSVLNQFGSIMDELTALKAECESLSTRTDEAGQVSDD